MNCLNEETIVAFIDAQLGPDAIERVESHVRACASCRELLSVALVAAPAPRLTERPLRESTHARAGEPAPLDGATLVRGTSFGRYTVLGPLGRGAMGEVYAAYDPELDRKVALKILHARGGAADGRSRSRLLREAKAIAKLRHPNVVLVHDAGTIDQRVFLAMEHIEGQTLAGWVAEGNHTRKEILDVFIAAGRGLGAAHAAGLAHRDFKPQNVMVGSDGGVRVMDFGLAREIGSADRADREPAAPNGEDPASRSSEGSDLPLTRTGELVGTPLYMAPEQFKTQRADARSDQFSFCVALYHALHGAHPFGGGKLGDLIAAVTAGRVQSPPPKSAVPPWLRRILMRGLSVDPKLRWESMEALTAALSRDPVRQRLRWLGGAAAGAALIAGVVALRAPRTSESICRGGPARLAGVWEPEGGGSPATRRAATRASFLKTGVAGAADAWDRAARLLDRYTTDWLRMYGDTCAATHLRGEQSADVLDLRMACLQERLGRVQALTEVFIEANPTVIENAVTATTALPALDRCADVKLLRAVMPPPDDPAVRVRVEALRNDLARVKALTDSGQCSAAARARPKLIAAADELGYLPLQAESLASTSRPSTCVAHDETIPNLRRGFLLAVASHHEEVAAEAAILLAHMEADRTSDVSRAQEVFDVAGAIMQGMSGNHPVLETWRLEALATIQGKVGDTDSALESIKRALILMEKTQGSDHLDYVNALTIRGAINYDGKRYEEAVTAYRRAAAVALKVGGPDHPAAAFARADAAESLNCLHRYDEAAVEAQEALRLWRHAGGPSVYQGYALTNLGEALLGQGRAPEAVLRLEEALSLLRDDPTALPQAARFALARARWELPDQRPRALALAREAKAGYEHLGNLQAEVAKVDTWLRARNGTRSTTRRPAAESGRRL